MSLPYCYVSLLDENPHGKEASFTLRVAVSVCVCVCVCVRVCESHIYLCVCAGVAYRYFYGNASTEYTPERT